MVRVPGSNNVEFRGLEMDRIKQLVELCPDAVDDVENSPLKAQLVLQCEASCLELSKATYNTDGEIPPQHILTLVTGMHPDRTLYDVPQATEDYHHMRDRCRTLVERGAYDSSTQDQKAMISAQRYKSGMNVAWKGSSFFCTEGGRIGMGPKSAIPGDSICIFFGAHVPHILRFDPVRKVHSFIGAAFVCGLMSGDPFYAKGPINTYECFVVG
jgi:hypothetical protein